MVVIPRGMFRLLILSGFILVLMSAFSLVHELFRDPAVSEYTIKPVDEEALARRISEEQELRRSEWAALSQKDAALELDHRLKKYTVEFFENMSRRDEDTLRITAIYLKWGFVLFITSVCFAVFGVMCLVFFVFMQKQNSDLAELQTAGKAGGSSFWRKWFLLPAKISLVPSGMLLVALAGFGSAIYYFDVLAPIFSQVGELYHMTEKENRIIRDMDKFRQGYDDRLMERINRRMKQSREEMLQEGFKMERVLRDEKYSDPVSEDRSIFVKYLPLYSQILIWYYAGIILWALTLGWGVWHARRQFLLAAEFSIPGSFSRTDKSS